MANNTLSHQSVSTSATTASHPEMSSFPATGEPGFPRPTEPPQESAAARLRRKRASKACLTCRARKVRCDVTQCGIPCTNCRLDSSSCTVKPRPSRYATHYSPKAKDIPVTLPTFRPLPKAEERCLKIENEYAGNPSYYQPTTHYELPRGGANIPGKFDDQSSLVNIMPYGGCSAAEQPYQTEGFGQYATSLINTVPTVTDFNLFQPPERASIDHSVVSFDFPLDSGKSAGIPDPFMCDWSDTGTDWESSPARGISTIPNFLSCDTSHLSDSDIDYLEKQDCFRIPPKPVLDEFVAQYFLHLHPNLPFLDEGTFWELYGSSELDHACPPRISLFVFQAMLFASCNCVSLEALQKAGFANSRDARASLVRRARLLFDFECEKNLVSMAQGSLLLSYYTPNTMERKVNYYWLTLAVRFATQAGAPRYYVKSPLVGFDRNLLKRLWWCCIIRDRILPLCLRGSIQITPAHFDFSAEPMQVSDFESETDRSFVYDAKRKRQMADLFVTQCRLAVALTDVLLTVYPLEGSQEQNHNGIADPACLSVDIERCKSLLADWYDRAGNQHPTSNAIGDRHDSLILFTDLIYMHYHTDKAAPRIQNVFERGKEHKPRVSCSPSQIYT